MKKSLTKRIIFSYLLLVCFSMAFIGIVYSLAAIYYSEVGALKSLQKDAAVIANTLKEEIRNEHNLDQAALRKQIKDKLNAMKALQCSYAVLGKNGNVIYPKTGPDAKSFKENVLPKIINKILAAKSSSDLKIKPTHFQMDESEYVAFIAKASSQKISLSNYWVVLYTEIAPVNQLIKNMLFILLFTILLTSLVTAVIGVLIGRSIVRPIILLKNRAHSLAQRDFDTQVRLDTQDELEELAAAINKMASELKTYDAAQKKFLQNASHELKTPLMSIQGYAEGLKDGIFENNDQALDIIIEESSRLKRIVEELIYLSKLETMEDFYTFTPESIFKILNGSIEKINGLAMKNSLKVNVMLYKDVVIELDQDKLTQALINILGNCLRYAKSEINITTANDGKFYEILIQDDGEGFAPHEPPKIFDRFYKGKKGNTGLGLAITKVIIEKHGGTIEAANSINGGAEFKIRLRLASSNP